MTDGTCCILRALSLRLCLRRIAILLLLDQQTLSTMSLSRATGQYRQLIQNDIAFLFGRGLIKREITPGHSRFYSITEPGKRVLAALSVPLELVAAKKGD